MKTYEPLWSPTAENMNTQVPTYGALLLGTAYDDTELLTYMKTWKCSPIWRHGSAYLWSPTAGYSLWRHGSAHLWSPETRKCSPMKTRTCSPMEDMEVLTYMKTRKCSPIWRHGSAHLYEDTDMLTYEDTEVLTYMKTRICSPIWRHGSAHLYEDMEVLTYETTEVLTYMKTRECSPMEPYCWKYEDQWTYGALCCQERTYSKCAEILHS